MNTKLEIMPVRSIHTQGLNTVVDKKNDPENPKNPGPIVQRIEQVVLDSGSEPNQVRKIISEVTGVSAPALVKWFNGDTAAPSVEHIVAIQEFFKVDLTWLITGRGDTADSISISDAASKKIQEGLIEAHKKNSAIHIDLPRLQSVNISCDSIFPKTA